MVQVDALEVIESVQELAAVKEAIGFLWPKLKIVH